MEKAAIFDFGGTLDTNGVHWSVKFQETYQELGYEFSQEDYNFAFVKSDEELKLNAHSKYDYRELLLEQSYLQLKYLMPEGLASEKELMQIAGNAIEKIMVDINRYLDESKKIFEVLKKNYGLAIVSNFYGNLEKICDRLGFKEYVDVYIDSESVKIAKPHPGIFSFALQRLGVLPQNSFVIGDSYERDIVPSKILGCKTIWLRKKSFKESVNIESADFIVNDLADILRYLT